MKRYKEIHSLMWALNIYTEIATKGQKQHNRTIDPHILVSGERERHQGPWERGVGPLEMSRY